MADAGAAEARVLRELFVYSMIGSSLALEDVGSFVSRIGAAMLDLHLRAGEVAYRKGEAAEHVLFIVSGELELVDEGAAPRRMGDRSVLAIDALLGRPRSRTAIALRDVHLLKVDAETWIGAIEDSFDAARGAILRISTEIQPLELAARFAEAGHDGAAAVARAAPPPLEGLALVDRILALRDIDLLEHAHMQAITMLAELAEEVRLAAGELLFGKRTVERALFLVVFGEIILADESGREHRVKPGRLVGGTGSMASLLVDHEARASASSLVLRVNHDDYWDVMEEHVDLVRSALLALLAQRERFLPSG